MSRITIFNVTRKLHNFIQTHNHFRHVSMLYFKIKFHKKYCVQYETKLSTSGYHCSRINSQYYYNVVFTGYCIRTSQELLSTTHPTYQCTSAIRTKVRFKIRQNAFVCQHRYFTAQFTTKYFLNIYGNLQGKLTQRETGIQK